MRLLYLFHEDLLELLIRFRADDLVVKADVPKALRKALKADMPKITHMCVRENAEHVLRWFEQIIVEHVLRGQTKSTAFRTLTGRRVDEEQVLHAEAFMLFYRKPLLPSTV